MLCLFFSALRFCSSPLLLFAPRLSLRHFDRNEDHDNRRNEYADRKKDRSKDMHKGGKVRASTLLREVDPEVDV